MLRSAKLSVLEAARAAGVMSLVSRTGWRRQRLLILCYHGISMIDEHFWNSGLFMPPDLFERRLKALQDGGFHVLPLDEALDRLNRNDLPPKSVVLTFDDGFADFHEEAFPILQKYKMPATVYLSTYYCYNNIPIPGLMMRYLMWRARESAATVQDAKIGWKTPQNLATPEGVDAAYRLIDEFIVANEVSAAGKEEITQALAGHLKLDYDAVRRTRVMNLMTPAEVKEVHDGGVSIELHTHRHRTPHDPSLFAKELRDNREKIEAITGQHLRHFCYPSGVWRRDMLPILEESGVVSATTCEPGLAMRTSEPLLLPRHIDTTSQTNAEFEGWLCGVSQFLPKRSLVREN